MTRGSLGPETGGHGPLRESGESSSSSCLRHACVQGPVLYSLSECSHTLWNWRTPFKTLIYSLVWHRPFRAVPSFVARW